MTVDSTPERSFSDLFSTSRAADATLHEAIQMTMGWTFSHLWEFDIDGRCYGDPSFREFDDEPPVYKAKGLRLGVVISRGVERFVYTYDCGDNWRFFAALQRRCGRGLGTWLPLPVADFSASTDIYDRVHLGLRGYFRSAHFKIVDTQPRRPILRPCRTTASGGSSSPAISSRWWLQTSRRD